MFKKNITIWVFFSLILSILVAGTNFYINDKINNKEQYSSTTLLKITENKELVDVQNPSTFNIDVSGDDFSDVLTNYLGLTSTQNEIFLEAGNETRYSNIDKVLLYNSKNLGDNTLSVSSVFESKDEAEKFQQSLIENTNQFISFYNSGNEQVQASLNDEGVSNTVTMIEEEGVNSTTVFLSTFFGVFFISIIIVYFVKSNKHDK